MMKKILVAGACLLFASITSNEVTAQTRYGVSEKSTTGGTTTYTCPTPSTSVCQTWGTNADGTRYCIVSMPNGDLIAINVKVSQIPPQAPQAPRGTYVQEPRTGQWYIATGLQN